jgi:DNA-binding FrmR family transcriptional regulator
MAGLSMHQHPSHTQHIGKLNRVSGQVEAVKRMIEEGQYCVDIMVQIRAARSALKAIELAVLETHMKSCLHSAACCHEAENRDTQVEEIMALLKKYE